MRYGAIDIGSNAVRLMVKEIREEAGELRSDKVAYTRIPIRLGEDVFETGRISPAKQEALTRAIEAFRLLFESMEVADYRACATSAMGRPRMAPKSWRPSANALGSTSRSFAVGRKRT